MKGLGSGHVTCGPMRGLEKNCMGRGHISIYIYIYTFRLLDRIGPEGRFGENMVQTKQLCENIKMYMMKITKVVSIINVNEGITYTSTIL